MFNKLNRYSPLAAGLMLVALLPTLLFGAYYPSPALVGNNADAEASVSTGLLPTEGYPMLYNTATGLWDRARNGAQPIASSAAVALPIDLIITGQAATTSGNNALATDGNTTTTVTSYHSGSVQIVGTAGISAGAAAVEQSNDGNNWTLLPVQEATATAQTLQTGPITIAASSARLFQFALNANFIRVRVSTAFVGGSIQVFGCLSQLPLATPAVTVAQGTASSLNGQVTGPVAHSSAIGSSNPVPVALVVKTAFDTTLVEGDSARATGTTAGQWVIKPYGDAANDIQYSADISVTTQQTITAAGAAGIRNYCTGLQLQNTGSNTTVFTLQDGATRIWAMTLPGNMTMPAVVPFATPLKGTAATAMNFTFSANSTTSVNFQGYKSP